MRVIIFPAKAIAALRMLNARSANLEPYVSLMCHKTATSPLDSVYVVHRISPQSAAFFEYFNEASTVVSKTAATAPNAAVVGIS